MGNHRFRLSDMMPNAWFYKLRDMRKPTNQNPTKSFYDQTTKPIRRRAIYMPSPRKNTNFTIFADDVQVQTRFDDIIINVHDESLHLPPILTKPVAKQSPIPKSTQSVEIPTENGAVRSRKKSRKSGVKIRASGRKLARKKVESGGRKSVEGGDRGLFYSERFALVKPESGCRKSVEGGNRGLFYSESFALVKSSSDPERDFKDSMMEMIVENRIRELKDLEDLLACYLSLNSNQYHDVIIRAFEQIWFDMKE